MILPPQELGETKIARFGQELLSGPLDANATEVSDDRVQIGQG